MDIITKLERIRRKKGLSIYKLAKEAGISKQTYSNWLLPNRLPTLQPLECVCDVLDISLVELLSENEVLELTPENKKLIESWRCLNEEEKQTMLALMENFKKAKNS